MNRAIIIKRTFTLFNGSYKCKYFKNLTYVFHGLKCDAVDEMVLE